ncbi:intraflagellar transport protein 140 homolog isoform X2 [Aethina tumida]|uniref:intraflagellar transport protein 140 homolog isoform X2 n=1 Tax=Aethina tumida TaxID=116153 RepID=UPI0021491E81|nr:intraflagellar transport protein 140 homolog isoform X2 [Aethina tumida]
MTLYFEYPVLFSESGNVSIDVIWHPNEPLLAVASFSQDRGGFVTIFDELGESLKNVIFPVHRSYQVTSLAWHPEKTVLITGWENGELRLWDGTEKEFFNITGLHKCPVILLEYSEKGGRLVSCDSTGSIVGWKVDSKGQINTAFHLDLKEQITHLTFRLTVKPHPDYDVEGLARAAVNGDEHALDMFSNWRPKTTARKFRVQDGIDNLCFYVATQVGSVYYVNGAGSCSEVLNTEGIPLTYVVYHPIKDSLVIMMEGLTIGHFSVDYQGHLTELAKVKLSGRMQTRSIGSQGLVWISNSALAILTGELTVRVWDIETNDNYVLPTSLKLYATDEKTATLHEIFTCLAYCKMNQTLCAGTNTGKVYFWSKRQIVEELENPEELWELNNINTISGTVKQIMWGSMLLRQPLLTLNCVTTVFIMKEQTISTCYSNKIWGIQKTASQILLESENGNTLLKLDNQITDMAATNDHIVFTNGRSISVYQVFWKYLDNHYELNTKLSKDVDENLDFTVKHQSTIKCENEGVEVSGKQVVALTQKGVVIRSFNMSNSTTITSTTMEGEPIGINVTGNYLTIFTIEGFLKVYDLSGTEPKLVTPIKNLAESVPDFGEVIQAKTNSDGTKVALTIAGTNLIPNGKLFIWDIESDRMTSYNFKKIQNESGEDDEEEEKLGEKTLFDEICAGRVPLAVNWDKEDPRLLVCDAKKLKSNSRRKGFVKVGRSISNGEQRTLKDEDHVLITMFISSENSLKMHDIKALEPETQLLAVSTPYIALLQKLSIVRETMGDFVGLENCDNATRHAVLDFSYNLSLGNMDAAFKSIKLVKSSGVWNSLARMCVKTRRLDVAGVCLGHMGNAQAARALRLAIADQTLPLEAKVAVLAVHLGMLDEAEQLYVQCNRYDLLNKLLRSRNKMDAAHAIAESKDRIHLRNTEYAWAKILEQNGEIKEAISRFEKANTHKQDVPKMLIDQPQLLQTYMAKTKDPDLLKWWGQYVESQGDMATALKIYASAGDVYSQVRVLCFLGEEEKAADLARANSDKAAFYHMARYYETVGNYEDAVFFFTKATAYGNAVRLCKENNMSEELWNLGFIATPRDKIECAKYFEEGNELSKAVVLYHRAGKLHKALDLAFKTQQFDILQQIATDLDATSDPALIEKCAEYFVTNEQFDKAVDLLAMAKKYTGAIELCLKHNVMLNEDLAEKLTPEKELLDEETRTKVLEDLAESLMVQGNYHLATKKFTQAGDKIRAMKALLKSGDTEKIVFFASISRQREIYIMAANYLQSLDWQNQPEVLRNIIVFYSKGKALDLLANFYVACAQVEIDEFQNYEKAYGALTEAARCLSKITQPKDVFQHQRAGEIVQQRLTSVKRFVDIRRLFERGDLQAGMTQCQQLLTMGGKELEDSVRRGDIYAQMIQELVKVGKFLEAKELTLELKQYLSEGGSPLTYYLGKEVIETLAKGLGVSVNFFLPPSVKVTEDDNDTETVDEVLEE